MSWGDVALDGPEPYPTLQTRLGCSQRTPSHQAVGQEPVHVLRMAPEHEPNMDDGDSKEDPFTGTS